MVEPSPSSSGSDVARAQLQHMALHEGGTHPYHHAEHLPKQPSPPVSETSPGYHLLERMGWHPGHGLGKHEQGVLEPPAECEPDKARADFEEGHLVDHNDELLREEEERHFASALETVPSDTMEQ